MSDEEVTDFKVRIDGETSPAIDIPSEQFAVLAEKPKADEMGQKIRVEKTRLNLLKVVFDKRYKWDFYNNGIKISASIKNNQFLDRVASGEKFAKGDVLVGKLQANLCLVT